MGRAAEVRCAYATRRRRLIPDPVANSQDGKENQPPAASPKGWKRKAEATSTQGASMHDGLPLLSIPGLSEAVTETAEVGVQVEGPVTPEKVACMTRVQGVMDAFPAEATTIDRKMSLAMDPSSAETGVGRASLASREVERLSSVHLVSGASHVIHNLNYTAPSEDVDEAAFDAADELLKGRVLGDAVERAVSMEMAALDSSLALPDGSEAAVADVEYKGYVGALLKLIARRALERSRRRIGLATPSRWSTAVEGLQGEEGQCSDRVEGRCSDRGPGESESQWQELKRLMYEDACAREEYARVETELREAERQLEELALGASYEAPMLGLDAYQALAGLL